MNRGWVIAVLLLVGGFALGAALWHGPFREKLAADADRIAANQSSQSESKKSHQLLASFPKIRLWWEEPGPPEAPRWASTRPSNIHPEDYLGAQACRNCHPKNYQAWSQHPHKGMNALASAETVKGDFSGQATIAYKGGKGSFLKQKGEKEQTAKYLMILERPPIKRVYEIHQTIGIRFYQYYVGTQIEGPEPREHHFYGKDHVLPFGYWLERNEWVPVVHIGPERPDEERADPFQPPEKGRHYAEYAPSCNGCHTTFALGDMLTRRPAQMAEHAPFSMNWSMKPFLEHSRPQEFSALEAQFFHRQPIYSSAQAAHGHGQTGDDPGDFPPLSWDARHYAVSLGISCEACHLGAKKHAETAGKSPPDFYPSSPFLTTEAEKRPNNGRTHDNVNWSCGRCHTGNRPTFAGGMSTWNSVEFSDAMKGSCYSQLTCTDCHNPHEAIGPIWTAPPRKDDAVCLKCHETYRSTEKRLAHTHHPAGSDGDRCLNCHMPRINEGINDLVRTHMIFSPTKKEMIQENHPNACNLCHLEKSIDWTLENLKGWYGKTYEDWRIRLKYPDRSGSTAKGWLESTEPAVRLVGALGLIRSKSPTRIPEILEALDDPYLLNRQFAAKALEDTWNLRLADFGYHFYQTKVERKGPIEAVAKRLKGK